MTGLNFKQMAEKEQVKDIKKLEDDFPKLPEVGFKMTYKKKKDENYAEDLVKELKGGEKDGISSR